MADPNAHYRIVYTSGSKRIISMSHVTAEKANSLAALVDSRAKRGRFTVEDEYDDGQPGAEAA